MNKILFRQKMDNGQFHFWGYIGDHFVSPLTTAEYSDTPSDQAIGLQDKNGNEIFENDIVECNTYIDKVERDESGWMPFDHTPAQAENSVIIGNMHFTPELLPPEV